MNAPYMAMTREPLTLVLDESGMICDCCRASEELFGYTTRQLVSQHVSQLFPELSGIPLIEEGRLNSLLEYKCRCGHVFWAHNRDGGSFPSELTLVKLEHAERRILRMFILPDGPEAAAL